MEDKEKAIKQLYDVAMKSAKTSPPKRSLFSGAKCPKCGAKLQKGAEKLLVVTGGTASPFVNEVAVHLELDQGAYNLSVEHYKCPCGYEYAKVIADAISD